MRWNNTERGVSFHSSTQDETFEERGGTKEKRTGRCGVQVHDVIAIIRLILPRPQTKTLSTVQ